MNDEAPAHIEPPERSPLRRILDRIPPRSEEVEDHVGAEVAAAAIRRSEARRDAVLAVLLAIKRRGQNPLTEWSTKDVDAAYGIAEILIALG